MSDRWKDARSALETIKTEKELGAGLYCQCELKKAFHAWQGALAKVDIMREGTSWDKLIGTKLWGPQSKDASMPPKTRQLQKTVTEVGLQAADFALELGQWKAEYRWRRPEVLCSKALYRKAVCISLWGDTSDIVETLQFLKGAL
ncbi:hypothetical protein G6011_00860 [Alternaria panax]|uniref:Uncharacterized protein n=1 Tax=Alternaria panax TaxID=48097 RepID=A0AAD4IK14_9PLEO|nr:hypothetical protein G6011_00860 [Alternaria panax]